HHFPLLFPRYSNPPHLHSFPTRRSSDLKTDHRTRALAYGRAMEEMAQRYPQDVEVLAFYALSLQATADPKDKTYVNQKRSAEIRSEEHTSELQSLRHLVCRLLLEKKNND